MKRERPQSAFTGPRMDPGDSKARESRSANEVPSDLKPNSERRRIPDAVTRRPGLRLRLDQGIQLANLMDLEVQRTFVQAWMFAEAIVQGVLGQSSLFFLLFGPPEEIDEELKGKQRTAREKYLAVTKELSLRRDRRKRTIKDGQGR